HLPANDDWSRCVFVTQLRIRDLGIPYELPSPRIQSHDARVPGRRKDFVAKDCDVSLNASAITSRSITLSQARNACLFSATGRRCRGGPVDLWAILPDQIPGRCVQSLKDTAWIRQVHDAVINERCRLVRARVVHRPGPGELELMRVLPID